LVDTSAVLRYNTLTLNSKGADMYALQVLNDANEWELINTLFKSEAKAIAFFNAELSMFNDYIVTHMQKQ
jgi:hypothetical protein